jgi:hypothetical protein
MRTLFLALCVAASFFVSGCMVTTTTRSVTRWPPPSPPAYVYTYVDGCWAGGYWYSPCPWAPGPSYGYYAYGPGGWYYQPQYRWEYRPGHPPPSYWRRPPPAPPRSAPPPRPRGRRF